ncbi:MAG: hypothetical protein L6Q77_14950 [Bacteroidetes bacterium]|nr:hypothetical protein [Bacteroidota bacterium]
MMNTKLLMTGSAVFMGCLGIAFSFIPEEILAALGQTSTRLLILMLQLTGAVYFGLALTNWTAKSSLIGGIYSRPLSLGNFAHFLIGSLALLKSLVSGNLPSVVLAGLAFLYVLFAAGFGYVLFTHPGKNQPDR